MNAEKRRLTEKEWHEEGRRRFGTDFMKWKFVCPCCGHSASVKDYQDAGAPEGAIAFSCIGRYNGNMDKPMGTKPGPCNYTTGGLFNMSPLTITFEDRTEGSYFDFNEVSK